MNNKNIYLCKDRMRTAINTTRSAALIGMPPTKTKLAFTLAEVLITLGIIGIVAAMTIPTLMQKYYERQTVAKLLETSSIIAQAIKLSEEEYGEIAGWGVTRDEESAKLLFERFSPFLKVAVDCGTVDDNGNCFAKEKYAYLSTPNRHNVNYNSELPKYKFSLINGTSVMAQGIYTGDIQFNIDTNGPSKPNIVGKDMFLFQYKSDTRSFVPMGSPNSFYPYESYCNLKSMGVGCAYYVLTFKNMDYLHNK